MYINPVSLQEKKEYYISEAKAQLQAATNLLKDEQLTTRVEYMKDVYSTLIHTAETYMIKAQIIEDILKGVYS